MTGLTTPAGCATDLAACPVATAEIAAEVQQQIRERFGSSLASGGWPASTTEGA